jgi:peptide deformylase
VHVPARIFLVEVRGGPANPRYPSQGEVPLTVLINPEIVRHSDETAEDWEGCLSIPDLRGRVPRWTSLTLSALDRESKPVTIEAADFFARVIQHELDHLDGVMFLDRMKDFATLTYLREFQKFWLPVAAGPG